MKRKSIGKKEMIFDIDAVPGCTIIALHKFSFLLT